MKFIKKLGLALGLAAVMSFSFAPVVAYAQFERFEPLDQACQGEAASSDICQSQNQRENPISGTNGLILRVVNILSLIVGIAATIMIIVGGIKLTTSAGDTAKVKSGRETVLFALVGVVVVLLARAIIIFVVNRV